MPVSSMDVEVNCRHQEHIHRHLGGVQQDPTCMLRSTAASSGLMGEDRAPLKSPGGIDASCRLTVETEHL